MLTHPSSSRLLVHSLGLGPYSDIETYTICLQTRRKILASCIRLFFINNIKITTWQVSRAIGSYMQGLVSRSFPYTTRCNFLNAERQYVLLLGEKEIIGPQKLASTRTLLFICNLAYALLNR